MNHQTQLQIFPESDTAVLLIHGILGTPHQFDFLMPAIPTAWSTVNLLLDGHGGSVTDFGRSSMKKWEAQVAEQAEKLCATHKTVLIVAHSMGTLFAIDAALTHPTNIKGLFLLSPPLKIGLKPHLFKNVLKVGLGFSCENDPAAMAAKRAYSMPPDRRVWKYIRWIPRYLELFAKILSTRKKLPLLYTQTKAFLCENDEMVSIRSDRLLLPHPTVEVSYLPGSSHFAYGKNDAELLRKAFTEFYTQALKKQ